MSITQWPEGERPREKMLAQGAAALSDAELLAIFLRTGRPGRSALDLARELLSRSGGLRVLLSKEAGQLCSVDGVGLAKATQLKAVMELAQRCLREGLQRDASFSSSSETKVFLSARLRDRAAEAFCCLFLDNRHRMIAFEELFQGSISGAAVYPREVVKRALALNAAAVIFAHNHPSGVAEPSEADRLLTLRLKEALALVDVRVLDHLVVGDNVVVSFSERGLL